MNELVVFVPSSFSFNILELWFQDGEEIAYVFGSLSGLFLPLFVYNKKARETHGAVKVFTQCFSRVALDVGLVIGICGSMIGVVAMTVAFDLNADVERSVSIALLTMLWGGIFVGLGYFTSDHRIHIETRLPGWGVVFTLVIFMGAVVYMFVGTKMPLVATFSPFASVALIPYAIVFLLCFVFYSFTDKPWVVSFTDANLLATIGGLGMGIVFWFTSGGGYEAGRAAIYTCSLVMMWGCFLYVLGYVASLYLNTQEQGNYQIKTWHLSEAAVFFMFLLYAPVGATEWQRESKDQAAQRANNLAQQQEIDALKAQIATLMEQTEKT